MIRRLSGTFVLSVVALVSSLSLICQAQSQTLVTRHTREEVVNKTVPLVGHLSPSKNLRIVLVLQHRNQGELEQFLKDVQNPSHPSYHKYLTVEQFTERYGPSVGDYEIVKAWARDNGLQIKGTSVNRMILPVSGTVDQLEKALHVSFNVYQHPTESRTFFAPDREPTPNMGVRLWSIGGLDTYSTPRRNLIKNPNPGVISNATTGSCPSQSFCGSDMRAAYYTAGGGTLTGTGQSIGLFEFIGTDLADLTTYFTNAGQTNNVPVTLTSVDTQSTSCTDNAAGGFCDDTEQTLDMTQAISMAPGMSGLTMWIGTGGKSGQTLDDPGILNGMATAKPLQNALSCSWEWRPTDNTTDDPFFQEFQAQGQTFFVAAGDGGNWAHASFVWPSDDPFIVSVGGTDLKTSSAGGPWMSETGWVDTGGGISVNSFPIPTWQTAAAAGCTKCSQTLRNGPDVSANADFTFYVCADQTTCTANNFGGTSFAAPMWAGIVALANQQAANNGNAPVGFINPFIYDTIYANSTDYAADFHDITSGGNTLGSTVGYDLSTGLGSPQTAIVDALAGGSTGTTFSIGGTLSGLGTSLSVVLQDNGGDNLTLSANGGFTFATKLANGAAYNVTVLTQPTGQTCTVTNGSGTVNNANVTNVSVTCTTNTSGDFTIAAAPKSLSVTRGTQGHAKVTTTISGSFNSAVALTSSGAPTGVKISFQPASIPAPGSGSSAMRINVASTAKTGTSTITITGTGGGKTHTATITLTIK